MDQPIEPDYDPIAEADHHLDQADWDRLEELIHPVAEQFIAQFDARPITAGLPRGLLKFSACTSEAAARRLFGQLMLGFPPETYALIYSAMMVCVQLGWLAAKQHSAGMLEIPEVP